MAKVCKTSELRQIESSGESTGLTVHRGQKKIFISTHVIKRDKYKLKKFKSF
jgi:hypothetical protein